MRGFDFVEIEKALDGGAARGASTISQQVAKNVFLWPDRSWVRKGAEAGFTLLIEALWPKRRIIEVYLNVAEFGEGVFGAEAGAQAAYGKSAANLTLRQSARLVAILPNPKNREPQAQVRRGARIAGGTRTLKADGRATCVQ
jgi:monofunctional biosynthetic peptidoglycan transglycosylase